MLRSCPRIGGTRRAGAEGLRRHRVSGVVPGTSPGPACRGAVRRPGRPGGVVRRRQGGAGRGRHGRPHAVGRRADRPQAHRGRAPAADGVPSPRGRGAAGRSRGGLAEELAAGGKTPLWDALDEVIVQEREGPAAPPADAVVVVRTAEPSRARRGRSSPASTRGLRDPACRPSEPRPRTRPRARSRRSSSPGSPLSTRSTPPPGGWGSCCSSVVRSRELRRRRDGRRRRPAADLRPAQG